MLEYTIKRLVLIIPVMLGIIILTYSISYIMPGDPVEMSLGTNYTQEQYEAKAKQMGVEGGYFGQLGTYLLNLVQGDLGSSYQTKRPVMDELSGRIWISFKLGLLSLLFTTIISIPVGILSAVRQNSVLDYTVTSVSIFLASMPGFWIALLLIILFCQQLAWLPASGLATWQSYILPIVCNGLAPIAMTARMTRSSMLEVIHQDYITAARSKGLKENALIVKHALKNALIPVITIIGAQFSMIVGGSVIIESIFSVPGMGMRIVTAINNRDYPMILATTIILSFFMMVIMLVVDLIYAYVDPRIKAEFSGKRWGNARRLMREKRKHALKGGAV
jgi:peptide/nickel transport system permease protein